MFFYVGSRVVKVTKYPNICKNLQKALKIISLLLRNDQSKPLYL